MTEPSEVGGGRADEFRSASEYLAFEVTVEQPKELPTKIEKTDIAPHAIKPGETEIIAQRHGAYIRDKEHPNKGSLLPEAAVQEKAAASQYFAAFLDQFPAEDQANVSILFVASDTQYFDGGRRSYETATLAQEAAQEVLSQRGLSPDQIINASGQLDGDGGPRPMANLREPNMLNESPEYLDFMLKKYGGINLDFWVAFEEDHHQDTRLAMGAEGPDDIADRMGLTLDVLSRYAALYHGSHPDKRLVVWASTHYDTISPFVKRDVFGVGKEQQLMVDYGAGITVDLDREGKATTQLGGKSYDVPLKHRLTRRQTPDTE